MLLQNQRLTFTPYQKLAIAILALLQFTVVLDFMIISPIGDMLVKSLSITTKQFGLAVSSYAFSAATSGIIAAGFIDKFERKRVLLFFFTGFIIGTIFCALANTYLSLLLARIITGLFGGVISSITFTVITDLFTPGQRGRATSTVQMTFSVSQILGIPFGIFIANKLGWHYTFFLIVILSVLILSVILLKLKPIDEHLKLQNDKNPFGHLWCTIKNKHYQVGFLGITFLATGGFMIMPFTSIFLVNNIHLTNADLPFIFMVTGISSLFVMPLIGKLSDKYEKFNTFLLGSVLAIIMTLIFTHLPVVSIWVVMLINVIMFAAIMGRVIPFQALNTMIPKMEDRGAYMSLSSSLQQISGGLGSVIAGMIVYQHTKTSPLENFDTLGYVVIGLCVLCVCLVYRGSVIIKNAMV